MVSQENALRESGDASSPPPRRPDEPDEAFFLDMHPGRSSAVQLPLGGGGGDTARFDAVVVDAPKAKAASAVQDCSVFIVPQVRGHHVTDGRLLTGRVPTHGAHCMKARSRASRRQICIFDTALAHVPSAQAAASTCSVAGSAQGREHEWMFASEEGQAQVAASCRSRRTVLVSMRRGQQYGDVDALKACSQPFENLCFGAERSWASFRLPLTARLRR